MSEKPLVSVIIPTKNSEDTIADCLISVRNQTYRNVEIIVVDCYSKDRTRLIARNYSCYIVLLNSLRTVARNYGSQIARGKYLFHLDSDMELAPKTIENCVALCEAENIDAVVIPEVSVGEGFWANCTSLEKRCYLGANFIEGVRLVRSSTFRAIGMYDLDLEAGEDWDLVIRLEVAGFKKGRIKDFVLHNEGKLLLSETITKKYYYGRTIQNYVRKHPSFSKLQLSPWRFISTANRKELLKDPLHTAGMLYMKMCQFAALQIGRILTIKRKRFK